MWRRIALSVAVVLGCAVAAQPDSIQSERFAAEQIVFVSDRTGAETIWRMDPDGAEARPLTTRPSGGFGDRTPHLSADGRRVALTTYRFGGWKIATMDANGGNLRRATTNPQGSVYEWWPRWSPDGQRLVFSRFREEPGIYIIARDGSGQRRLTDNSGDRYQERTGQARWFPDGARIVYARRDEQGFDLYSMTVDETEPIRITDHPAHEISPAPSPDGRRIAFFSNREGPFDLYVTSLADGKTKRLSQHAGNPSNYAPQETIYQLTAAWSPDGSRIAYVAVHEGREQIFVTDLDEANVRQVTTSGSNKAPTWSRSN